MAYFAPPLLNSASPWATTNEDLQALYDCPYTGAVTVRTSLLGGFNHDDTIHQYAFLTGHKTFCTSSNKAVETPKTPIEHVSSLKISMFWVTWVLSTKRGTSGSKWYGYFSFTIEALFYFKLLDHAKNSSLRWPMPDNEEIIPIFLK